MRLELSANSIASGKVFIGGGSGIASWDWLEDHWVPPTRFFLFLFFYMRSNRNSKKSAANGDEQFMQYRRRAHFLRVCCVDLMASTRLMHLHTGMSQANYVDSSESGGSRMSGAPVVCASYTIKATLASSDRSIYAPSCPPMVTDPSCVCRHGVKLSTNVVEITQLCGFVDSHKGEVHALVLTA